MANQRANQTLPNAKPAFGVLDGVKVVYAAVELAVPKAACIMAEWGADVTWLENTGAGDTIRDTPWIKQAERRNQRSVALNYFTPEGREVLGKLVADADILLESSKGGTWAKRGLTDELLWQINPKLVIVHVSGFGQTGLPEMVSRAAYDLTVMAYSGYMSQNGTPEQPMNPGPYAVDYFNTLMILSSALGALHKATATGRGESVDVAMFETLLAIGQYYLVDYLNAGVIWPRPGARNQNLCAIGEYKCADGFIGLCVYGVPQNKYLLEAIGLGELWGTEDYPEDTSALWLSSPKAQLIERKLEEYLAVRRVEDVESDFAAHRIAAQKVMEFPDLVKEEHLRLRGVWQDWVTADGQDFKGLGVFPKFAHHPGQVWRPMPPQGHDTAQVLATLGYTPAQVTQLAADGVVKLPTKLPTDKEPE
jgi:L-carnitine CoA-transferase